MWKVYKSLAMNSVDKDVGEFCYRNYFVRHISERPHNSYSIFNIIPYRIKTEIEITE